MKGNKKIRYSVWQECADAMRIPIFLNAVTEILTSTLLVVTANTLGKFADAALNLDLKLGLENVIVLAVCILLTVLVAPLFGLLGNFNMLKQALRHDNIVFGHYFDKEPEKAMALDSGQLQYELESAPNELRIQMVLILSKALALPICMGYLLYNAGRISWLLTGIMLLLAAVRLIVPMLFRTKLAELDRNEKTYFRNRRGYEVDVTANPHIIKLWGLKIPIQARFNHLFEAYFAESGSKNDALKAVAEQSRSFTNDFTQILLFVVGAITVAKGYVSPGEFVAVLVYLGVTQTLLGNVWEIIQSYPLMVNAANRVSDFYRDAETSIGKTITHFDGLRGNDILFSFGDKEVLHDLSFEIASGEKVAIVGENGSGKSTLGKIIVSLISSYEGTLSANGTDLKSLDVGTWRDQVAYAPQSPYLFHATVQENICFGNPAIDFDTVNEFLGVFGINYLSDRTVSEQSDLSGGERQKISIIRALVKNADLLVLDEPTNHLDQESIEWLKGYIKQTDKTVIVISHDAGLLEVVDKKIYTHSSSKG